MAIVQSFIAFRVRRFISNRRESKKKKKKKKGAVACTKLRDQIELITLLDIIIFNRFSKNVISRLRPNGLVFFEAIPCSFEYYAPFLRPICKYHVLFYLSRSLAPRDRECEYR